MPRGTLNLGILAHVDAGKTTLTERLLCCAGVIDKPGASSARGRLRLMTGRPADAAWRKLGAEPGLCTACVHAKLNETRRGTAYLRCTRAEWDSALARYPRLPVTECTGFGQRKL